jgi:hypothetical protein
MANLRKRAVCCPVSPQQMYWGNLSVQYGRRFRRVRKAWSNFSAWRATTSTSRLPRVCRCRALCAASGSVGLKNETVIVRFRISAFDGIGDAASPRRRGQHRREGLALRCRGISPRFVASSTCMGPPLTESPGQYRRTSGFTRGAHGGRTTCAAQCACSNDDGEQWRGIGCRPVEPNARHALEERPTGMSARSGVALRVERLRAWPRGPCQPDSRSGLKRRVTTATPFTPRWSRPRMASGACSSHLEGAKVNGLTRRQARMPGLADGT